MVCPSESELFNDRLQRLNKWRQGVEKESERAFLLVWSSAGVFSGVAAFVVEEEEVSSGTRAQTTSSAVTTRTMKNRGFTDYNDIDAVVGNENKNWKEH